MGAFPTGIWAPAMLIAMLAASPAWALGETKPGIKTLPVAPVPEVERPGTVPTPPKGGFDKPTTPPPTIPQPAPPTPPSAAEPAGDAETSPLVAACDAAAAHPDNRENPAGVAGVDYDDIDTAAAIEACRAAQSAFPEHGRSAYNLARALQRAGRDREAETAYLAAIAGGSARAELGLGYLYQEENSLDYGPQDAIQHFAAAAFEGVADAQFEMGWAYANGLGVTADQAEAVLWYRKAAAQGEVYSAFELGWAAENGLGMARDPAAAAGWYQIAADSGNLMAMNNLGWLYAQGNGVERDPARAVVLYRAAAEGGEPNGMGNLGWMLENGIGTAQDLVAAATWYRSAAMQDEPHSMLNLGRLYLSGNGVERNPDTALEWFTRANDLGNSEALSYIGELHETTQEYYDPQRAAWFYIRALKAGDDWPAERQAGDWDRETARAMQTILKDNGFYTGPIDGVMGGGSRAAMRAVLPQ